ncbi:MAG: FkbM family methyltransferase [Flavobacteriales bacterium]|nr:FkbM family methyltransferase [Flavobacteriales bacterium]
MGIKIIPKFNSNYWSKLLTYSTGIRLANTVPKGLRYTYDFLLTLDRKHIETHRMDDNPKIQYPIENSDYAFMFSNSSDTDIFDQIIIKGKYSFLINLLKSENLIIEHIVDAGANVGLSSIYLYHYFSGSDTIALEPNKSTCSRLTNKITINNINNIKTLNIGLYGSNTSLKTDYPFRDGQDWSFRVIHSANKSDSLFETITVSNLMKQCKIGLIDLFKKDIEDSEKNVFLEGNTDWLEKIKIIAAEIHDEFNCKIEIEDKLRSCHFVLYYSDELIIGINRHWVKS